MAKTKFKIIPICEKCMKDCKKEVLESIYESMKKDKHSSQCKNYKGFPRKQKDTTKK